MKEKIILTKVNEEKIICYSCGNTIQGKDFDLKKRSLYVIDNQIYCKTCYKLKRYKLI